MLDAKIYARLREDIHAAFSKATETATRQRDAELSALEVLWKAHGNPTIVNNASPNGMANTVSDGPVQESDSLQLGGSLASAVRDAVDALPVPFTRQNIVDWLITNRRELRPAGRKVSIATALSRMVGKHVVVIEQSAGRRPSLYGRNGTHKNQESFHEAKAAG